MSDEEKNDGVSNERMIYLKLFNLIMRWEHENNHRKEYSDKQMQERIKKQIQNSVTSD